MENNNRRMIPFAGIFLLVTSAFMCGVFFLCGGAHAPGFFKLIYLGGAIGIPGYMFLKMLTDNRDSELLESRGCKRSAVLESVEPDPKRTGHLLLTLRFDDTGESFTHKTDVQVDQRYVGERLWVIVDRENGKNREVLLRTLGEATPPRPDDGEKVFDAPLNDAMLDQERELAAAARKSQDRNREGE